MKAYHAQFYHEDYFKFSKILIEEASKSKVKVKEFLLCRLLGFSNPEHVEKNSGRKRLQNKVGNSRKSKQRQVAPKVP